MNRRDDALRAVEKAVELAPGNATYRRIYDQIRERR